MSHAANASAFQIGLSVRKLQSLVGYTSLYEFEDLIQDLSPVHYFELVDRQSLELSRKVYKACRRLSRKVYSACRRASRAGRLSSGLAHRFLSENNCFTLDHDYTLFFPTFNNAFELFGLKAIKGWRERCRYAACFINEVWASELNDYDYLLELLQDFDHIFVGLQHSVDLVAQVTGKPCTYLPIGVDALKFGTSLQDSIPRHIDICNIGRRSDITHQALLELAQQKTLFYYYDTVSTPNGVVNADKQVTFHVKSPQDHRLLLSNLLKRSRYFIANRAFVNDPRRTGGQGEIPSRFFEGAAAGTVMIGEPPQTEIFQEYFGWEDAIISVPFDAPHIGEVIAELESQPARVDAIRRNNMIQSCLRHDWLHRLQVVYDTFDLPASEVMVQRSAQLAARVEALHRQIPQGHLYAA